MLWRNMGNRKYGPICDLMWQARLHYKYLLKQCQQIQEMAHADVVANSMHCKDVAFFWKCFSKTYKKATPIAITANGATNPSVISAT